MLHVVKRGTKFQLLLKMFERLGELLFVQQRVAHRLLSKHHQKTVLQLLCYLQRWPEESQRSIVLALVHLSPTQQQLALHSFARKVVCLKEGECDQGRSARGRGGHRGHPERPPMGTEAMSRGGPTGASGRGGRTKSGKPRPGTGGYGKRRLEGNGPTPPAHERPGHPAQRRAA